MANHAVKTEHAGPKHGNGAYWGRRADAKSESRTERRRQDAEAVRASVEAAEGTVDATDAKSDYDRGLRWERVRQGLTVPPDWLYVQRDADGQVVRRIEIPDSLRLYIGASRY